MPEQIQVTLPDGSKKDVPKGTTPLDIARSISPRLADAALVAKIRHADQVVSPATSKDGWQFADLTRPLEQDVELRLLTDKDPEDLERLEKRMAEVVERNETFEREFIPRDEGLNRFRTEGDFMKVHFIEQFTKAGEPISTYRNGKFVDFCRGPHVPSTGKIKAFKLLNIAGAYWLGDEKNPQLQRIYGTSFFSKKDLDDYLHKIEESKKRDHRVLGQQLDLFSIQDLAGPGLIFWHPKGGIIRKEMEDWMREEYIRRGYSLVYTPHVARRQLFHTSGHECYYSQNMFDTMELADAEYRLKPMNCPGHILIYKDSLK